MCFFFISNYLTESKFKITHEFKSFCPEGLMGGTVHPAGDLHAVRSCKHTHSHEQTCMPTPAAAYKTHTQQECYIFISGVSTGSVPSWAQDCSAGRTDRLKLSMSLLRIKNAPITFFYSREYICDGSWHHVAILNIFLCCKSAQRRCEGASDPQGTRQIRRYTTSTNSWHVDIYNKVHYEMCQVSSETGQAHKRPTNSSLQKRPGQKHRQSRLEQWGGQKDVGWDVFDTTLYCSSPQSNQDLPAYTAKHQQKKGRSMGPWGARTQRISAWMFNVWVSLTD